MCQTTDTFWNNESWKSYNKYSKDSLFVSHATFQNVANDILEMANI